MLLITDIGRDMDDALALQTLAPHVHAGEAELVGVVTSGGNSKLKAGVARGWLRKLGFHDLNVLVAFGRAKGRKAVLSPPGFPSPKEAALASEKPEDAADAILRMAGQHRVRVHGWGRADVGEDGKTTPRLQRGGRALRQWFWQQSQARWGT